MCGILGLALANGSIAQRDVDSLVATMEALRSRGPDGLGWALADQRKVFFGHTRLAIFDLSDGGSQPMTSYDGRWIISFNGEIYNHRALAGHLARMRKDDSWLHTRSDTRILLECIAFFGLTWTLARIDGMAAFSLWDIKNRELHLFRDFCGEKPLFVLQKPDKVYFTSDLKAFPPEIWDLQVDAQALRWYLSFGYCHSERSIFKGIKQVKPGHLLSFRNEAGQWNCFDDHLVQRPLVEPTDSLQLSYPEKVQFLTKAIETSVAQQCKADVPVGIFLSGGIDSSLVTALANDYLPSVSAYTISMRGHGDLDESLGASSFARQFGLDHTIIDIADIDFRSLVEDFIRELGQPFGDYSVIPAMALSKIASKEVKVVLTGDGGDELFAGYNRHVWANAFSKNQFWLKIFRDLTRNRIGHTVAIELGAKILNLKKSVMRRNIHKIHRLRYGSGDPVQLYCSMVALDDLDTLLTPEFRSDSHEREINELISSCVRHLGNHLDASTIVREIDKSVYLPDDILFKSDHASMKYGLESRSPFLSQSVKAASSLFNNQELVKGKLGKQPLRDVIASRFGHGINVRGLKSGFTIPLKNMFLSYLEKDFLEVLQNELVADYLDVTMVRTRWMHFLQSKEETGIELFWRIYIFAKWLNEK